MLAYVEWGTDCLQHLDGIFAFAIWDEWEQELFVARDRIGVKPLFYTQFGDSFLFASEIKAILAHPDVHPEITETGLAELLFMTPTRTPGVGVFRGIQELKAGHWLKVSSTGISSRCYWRLTNQPHEDDFSTTVNKVSELLRLAVKKQLVSDVPIGTMLSGGLDSSAVAAIMTQDFQTNGIGPVPTFSLDYEANDQYLQPMNSSQMRILLGQR